MRRLTEVVKRRIVEHLACYRTHAEVTQLILDEFGVVLTVRHVRAYDPTSFQFAASDRLQDYHAQARKRFLEDIADVPISYRAFRLRQLGKIHDLEMRRGNTAGARATLEQAAKEIGNVFTNVSKVQGSALPGQLASTQDFSADEMRNMLADRLADAVDRMPNGKKGPTEH
jgi:hypothetical protein